jgi:PRC-barrel domain
MGTAQSLCARVALGRAVLTSREHVIALEARDKGLKPQLMASDHESRRFLRNVIFDPSLALSTQKSWRAEMATDERETGNLIGSDKVEGTAVYGTDNNKIGTIERVMIDKLSGKVSYAVLGFGGFLGIGDDHYPLPWQSLKYDTSVGGYRTNVTEEQLRGAPRYSNENEWNWTDVNRTRTVNDYYGY